MKITVFGSGYVGLVTGACFSDFGNQVTMVDIDAKKVEMLRQGQIPIFEPGLEAMVTRNFKASRLKFTLSAEEGLAEAEVVFVAVATPEGEDGRADLKFVENVARTVADICKDPARPIHFVLKSTVPVGTHKVCEKILPSHVHVVNNPEFLKEGSAVADFLRPERVVIGAKHSTSFEIMDELYAPFVRSGAPILRMSNTSAEVAKYAANSFLAMKVSFINDMAVFCENVGADVYDVRGAMITDSRIGNKFLYPSAGYGGSCFPKDVQALAVVARDQGMTLGLIEQTHAINSRQRKILPQRILAFLDHRAVKSAIVGLWGVAFKPDTDDIRESPALILIDELTALGHQVKAFDPEALNSLSRQRPNLVKEKKLILCPNAEAALGDVDVLAVMTEWNEFRLPDFKLMAKKIKLKTVFDGKNIYRTSKLEKYGLKHYGIGIEKFKLE